jgi:outer membrane protein assembly factor BamD (BamD/ComL family)
LREAESAERAKEEQRRLEAEAEQRAQEQRRLREAETARRAKEEELRKKAEAEARQRAAEVRRLQDAAAKQRAEAQQAFAAARRANTIAAIDAYEAAYPASHLAGEVQNLKAALLAREQAHRSVMDSADPAVLRSFLVTYKKGPDVNQARARLRVLEPHSSWYSSRQAIIGPSALAIILVGAGVGWLEMRPRPSVQPPYVTAAVPAPPLPQKTAPTPPEAAPAPPLPLKTATTPPEAAPAPAAPPATRPDEAAWLLVKDTNDAAALERFVEQFPDSRLRQDADARIAALAEEAAWNGVKDSNDPDQLRKFIDQFPNSPQRRDAEQRIASLAPTYTVASAPDPHELARSLQVELQRVGCFNDTVNGEFNDATKAALQRFIRLTSLSIPVDLSADAINAVHAITKRVCPLVCPGGKHANGDVCVPNPPPPPKPVAALRPPKPPPSHAAPAAAPRSAPSSVTLGVQ